MARPAYETYIAPAKPVVSDDLPAGETRGDRDGLDGWFGALDTIAALRPRAVVAGHKATTARARSTPPATTCATGLRRCAAAPTRRRSTTR